MSTLKEVKDQAWRELRAAKAEVRRLRSLRNAVEAAEGEYESLVEQHTDVLDEAQRLINAPSRGYGSVDRSDAIASLIAQAEQLGDQLDQAAADISAARAATCPAALAAAEADVEAAEADVAKATSAWSQAQLRPSREEVLAQVEAFWARLCVFGGSHVLAVLTIGIAFAAFLIGETETMLAMASAPFVASLDDKMAGHSDFVGAPERLVAKMRGARILQNLSSKATNMSPQQRRAEALAGMQKHALGLVEEMKWRELQQSGVFRVGMTKADAQFAVLADLLAEKYEPEVGQPLAGRLGTFLAKVLLHPSEVGSDDLALLGWEAHDGMSTYEYLHSLGRMEALRAALTEVYSSTLSAKLVDYGLGNTEELTVTRADIVQAHVYDMSRSHVLGLKASQWLVADDNPSPKAAEGTAHIVRDDDGNPKEDYVRERALPGVIRIVWEGDSEMISDRREVARAPHTVQLPSDKSASLLACQPKQSWYLSEDAPQWVVDLLEDARESCSSKQKSDLFTLLKRPGTPVVAEPGDESVVDPIEDVRPFEDEADFAGLSFSVPNPDLGVWVMEDDVYASVASGVEDSPVGGLQVTAVFDGGGQPWYFKGLVVPESLSAMPTGMYDGFKSLAPDATYGSGRCVRLSVMRSLGAEPWGSSVNSQALTYVGLQDGDEIPGVTEPGVQFPTEHVSKFTLGVNGLAGFTRELRDWCHAQVAQFGRKRSTDGFAGVALPVSRPSADAEFVLLTDGTEGYEDGEVLEAVFLWNPALPTHTELMKVRVVVEHRKELSGSRIIGVNVAQSEFLDAAYIDHAGRDIDGDGFVLSLESHLVENAVWWQDADLTDSTKWKAVEDEDQATPYDAVQESFERQFNSSKLGKFELEARRAIQMGVNMDATFHVGVQTVAGIEGDELELTVRQAYAGLIQMAISSQKKLVSPTLWNGVLKGLEEALERQQILVKGQLFRADHAVSWAGGMSPRAWTGLKHKSPSRARKARKFYALHEQDELDDFVVDGRAYKFLPTTLVDLTKLYGKALREQSAAEKQFGTAMQNWRKSKYPEWYPGTLDGLATTPFAVNLAKALTKVAKAIVTRQKLETVVTRAPGGKRVTEAAEGMFHTLSYGQMQDTLADKVEETSWYERLAKLPTDGSLRTMLLSPAYGFDHPVFDGEQVVGVADAFDVPDYFAARREMLKVFNAFSARGFEVKFRGNVDKAVGRKFRGTRPDGVFGALYDSTQGGRDERLDEIGTELKKRWYKRTGASELPEELIESFDKIMEFWARSGGQADYRQRVQYVITQLNKLVAEHGEDVVYGVALAGVSAHAPGKLSTTLVGHLSPATLARLAMAAGVDLFGDDGFPVVVRDISRFERGKSYTYGALMARLAEGSTASVLPRQDGVVYHVYGVGDMTVKTTTVKDRSFTSGGLIWVNPKPTEKIDPEDLIEVPADQPSNDSWLDQDFDEFLAQ